MRPESGGRGLKVKKRLDVAAHGLLLHGRLAINQAIAAMLNRRCNPKRPWRTRRSSQPYAGPRQLLAYFLVSSELLNRFWRPTRLPITRIGLRLLPLS
jgi:hypothetical protein